MKSNPLTWCILSLTLIWFVNTGLYAQEDPVTGFQPRLLTRGKLWSTYRTNGMHGGGNQAKYQSHDQTTLEYPGNVGRGSDFMEYWLDIAAVVAGAPNILDVARVCNPQNSKGEGVWVMGISDGVDTLVSYSGPRNVSGDIIRKVYPITNPNTLEHNLGDSTYENSQRSNWYPYESSITGNEPVEIHNYRYGDYIPNDEFPEEIILSQWANELGVTVTRKAYAWSYQDYDDFILEEMIFENTGSHLLTETFFSFMNTFSVSSAGHQWPRGGGMGWGDWRSCELPAQDDWFLYTGAPNYKADNPDSTNAYKDLILCYQRDDDWPGSSWDDTGQPFKNTYKSDNYNEFQGQIENQLMGYPYIGFGPVDFVPPFVGDDNVYVGPENTEGPYTFKWWHCGKTHSGDYDEPTATRHTDTEMYRMIIDPDLSGVMISENPDTSTLVTHALTFGPYTLNPGGKAKIVIAYVAGSGADWHNMDELEWSKSPEAKFQLKDGEHSIVRNFKRAKFAYEMGYDLPDPPPDVYVRFQNSDLGQTILKWSDAADAAEDPDYTGEEAKDVRGYKVYRSWPPSFDWHYGPWEFVADIPVEDADHYNAETHEYTYVDEESFTGYNYYYSVRTYDSGHSNWIDRWGNPHGTIPPLESGYASPEQKNMIAFTPFQVSAPIYNRMEEKIRVVPNPFRLDFGDPLHMYPDVADPYKLRFINLPNHCRIKIYSVNGDLVYEKEHTLEISAEDAWRQDTITFSGRIVSGIYFWVVESLTEESRGCIQKGTLTIVK